MQQELIVNLWAFFDAATSMVYALSGRVYCATGEDSEKLALLKKLSATDYITAKRYELSSRFEMTFQDGTVKKGVTTLSAVYDPDAQLFEEMFRNLDDELPVLVEFTSHGCIEKKQKISDDPICVVTVLYESESGEIRPIVTDEDRKWVEQQEQMQNDD